MHKSRCQHSMRRQRGATPLFVTLVLLLIVMLLGITGALLSGSQFQIAGNLQLENTAFNLAESAIAAAQSRLLSSPGEAGDASGDPITRTWSTSNAVAVGDDPNQLYVIQQIGSQLVDPGNPEDGSRASTCERFDLYRITGRGASSKGTVKIIQTTVKILSPTCH